MGKIDMSLLFPTPHNDVSTKTPRTYDVRVSLNKKGGKEGRQAIRFGLLNNAAKIFGEKPFIEASDVEYMKDRIYLRSYEEKANRNVHTLSTNGKSRTDSCYFSLTPSDKAEKIYRMNWINKTFPLFYDNEVGLYYIDMREED